MNSVPKPSHVAEAFFETVFLKSTPERGATFRNCLLLAAGSYIVLIAATEFLSSIRLPFDQQFQQVINLMWMGNVDPSQHMLSRYAVIVASAAMWASWAGLWIVLLGLLIPEKFQRPFFRAALGRASRYAVALPLSELMGLQLSRYVANLIYALARYVPWDFTPMLGRIETPFIEWLQHAFYSPLTSSICANLYSVAWYVPLFTLGFVLVLLDEPAAMNRFLAAFFLTAILAVPFFVLLPVFDPWTTNPLYNNPGAWHSHIAYLYPQAGVSLLQFINSPSDKWATGSCLPSLHVAIPLMVFWVLRKSRLQLLALFFLLLSLAEGFAVVYLGRHWVADVIFAAPYSYLVVRLVEHLNADFVWPRGYRQMSV